MEILKDYLLHICFILFPILLYQVFWLGKPAILVPKINSGLVTLFACGASVYALFSRFMKWTTYNTAFR